MTVFNTYKELKAYCNNPINSLENVELGQDITSLNRLFEKSMRTNAQFKGIENWDVSRITDMTSLFRGAKEFNRPIGRWNVSSVTSMNCMFLFADKFNQDINSWDVSSVTNMGGMFQKALSYNQPLDNWDMSKVTDTGGMFAEAVRFNQPLENWDVSSIRNMSWMFHKAFRFNRPLNEWKITKDESMFEGSAMDPENYPWVEKRIIKKTAEELRAEPMTESFRAYRNYEDKLKKLFRLCA